MDTPLAPFVRRPGCPPAPPSGHRYGGLGVSLGESEAWESQKVGGCGWTRCPPNSDLSHVAQGTARAWFQGVGAHCADFGAFWRLVGLFLGHIVELKGTRGLFDTVKSSRMWSVATVSLRLGEYEAWESQKVGGCGWTRCPQNSDLSHVAQDTARAWFQGVGAHCADLGAFWRLFGPFLGHIVELKGTRRLFDTVWSSRT